MSWGFWVFAKPEDCQAPQGMHVRWSTRNACTSVLASGLPVLVLRCAAGHALSCHFGSRHSRYQCYAPASMLRCGYGTTLQLDVAICCDVVPWAVARVLDVVLGSVRSLCCPRAVTDVVVN